MNVTCVLFGPPREAIGDKEVSVTVESDATIREVLEALASDYRELEGQLLTETGNIQDGMVVTLNKRHVNQLEGAATDVPEAATVRITPSLQGGA